MKFLSKILESTLEFDVMWYHVDTVVWEMVMQLDRPGEKGWVARELGLIDPHNANLLSFMGSYFRLLKLLRGKTNASNTTPAPAPAVYLEMIPTAGPTESVQSGHAYVTEASKDKLKEKKKTKGTVPSEQKLEATINSQDDEGGLEKLPSVLPTNFKLGK